MLISDYERLMTSFVRQPNSPITSQESMYKLVEAANRMNRLAEQKPTLSYVQLFDLIIEQIENDNDCEVIDREELISQFSALQLVLRGFLRSHPKLIKDGEFNIDNSKSAMHSQTISEVMTSVAKNWSG